MVIGSLLVGFLVAAVGVATFVVRKRRRTRSRCHSEDYGPVRPAVRLLSTEDELREAIDRAVAYERRSADRTMARIHRYSNISPDQPFTDTVSSLSAELVSFDSSRGTDVRRR